MAKAVDVVEKSRMPSWQSKEPLVKPSRMYLITFFRCIITDWYTARVPKFVKPTDIPPREKKPKKTPPASS